MRNQLTFINAIFCLLLVGKIAHFGTLGEFPAWKIIGVLVIDFLFDFWDVINARYNIVGRIIFALKKRMIHIAAKNNAKKIKKTL